ncbi:hypothetical protein KIH07_16750 [Hydrogenophaga taeniospiralis]|uniref:hypothetical protein n=1 Tax=Hydrogenophaga taeniospiralis TaxID=65656 RepID=UPI001CFAE870|nr:hypothetical protein [Hydrogenophaga taeniospiralis]MCB4365394.1 hypothetical protein [Hydrogenophaga taeniospiralis]
MSGPVPAGAALAGVSAGEFDGLQVVHYKAGYRYQLTEGWEMWVASAGIYPVNGPGGNDFVWLTIDGRLIVRRHYAWDGASGPAYNDKAFVRPALGHDAICQLWQLGVIDDAGRRAADKLLGRMLRNDMKIIANRYPLVPRLALKALAVVRPVWVVPAVQLYSRYFAGKTENPVLEAP